MTAETPPSGRSTAKALPCTGSRPVRYMHGRVARDVGVDDQCVEARGLHAGTHDLKTPLVLLVGKGWLRVGAAVREIEGDLGHARVS